MMLEIQVELKSTSIWAAFLMMTEKTLRDTFLTWLMEDDFSVTRLQAGVKN